MPGAQAAPLVPWVPPLRQAPRFLAPKLPKQHGEEALGQSSVHTRDTEVWFRDAGKAPGVTQLSYGGARYTHQMS